MMLVIKRIGSLDNVTSARRANPRPLKLDEETFKVA
jgi:hypothetical protein